MISSKKAKLVTLMALVWVPFLSLVPRADAHSEKGKIKVVTITNSNGVARVVLDVVFDDNDPASEASVTLAGSGPDGSIAGPVTLKADGTTNRFTGEMSLGAVGLWKLRATSVSPIAYLEFDNNVGASATIAAPSTSVSLTVAQETSTVVESTLPSNAKTGTVASSSSLNYKAIVLLLVGGAILVGFVLFGLSSSAKSRRNKK